MNSQDSLIRRINEVMLHFNMNISEFAAKSDIAQGNVSAMLNKKRTIGDGVLNKICISFDISKDWLLTGEGEMLKSGNVATATNRSVAVGGDMSGDAVVGDANSIAEKDIEIQLLRKDIERLTSLLEEKERMIQILLKN